MLVRAISDTHGHHGMITVDPCDILIHCGDATSKGKPNEIQDFHAWFMIQPARHRIFVPGNHDILFEKKPEVARSLMPDVHVLIEQGVEIEGVRIYGAPHTPRYGNFAFMLDTPEQAADVWRKIPPALDILITHGPAQHILDQTESGVRAGCPALKQSVGAAKPKWHLFGHIHEEGQRFFFLDGVKHWNVGFLDRRHEPHDYLMSLEGFHV